MRSLALLIGYAVILASGAVVADMLLLSIVIFI